MSCVINILCCRVCFYWVSLISSSVFASELQPLEFTPQVTVHQGSSGGGGLEITAEKTEFVALYSSSLNTFKPLAIPFTVRTLDGANQNYTIKLQDSQHYCQVKGDEAESLSGVGVSLDGTTLPSGSGAVGFPVLNKKESKHNMRVEFPFIEVVGNQKNCYGTLILIAEIDS